MLPVATKAQMAELDRLMVEEFGVQALMEVAGERLARFAMQQCPGARRILIAVGPGNNGGDGIVAARHLHNLGATLWLVTPVTKPEPTRHLETARAMGIPVVAPQEERVQLGHYDMVLDCLLGYNVEGAPRGSVRAAIEAINEAGAPVLACDIPSGTDPDAGPQEPHVRATSTLFLALPYAHPAGGERWVADIGVPKELYPRIGLPAAEYFAEAPLVPLDGARTGHPITGFK